MLCNSLSVIIAALSVIAEPTELRRRVAERLAHIEAERTKKAAAAAPNQNRTRRRARGRRRRSNYAELAAAGFLKPRKTAMVARSLSTSQQRTGSVHTALCGVLPWNSVPNHRRT